MSYPTRAALPAGFVPSSTVRSSRVSAEMDGRHAEHENVASMPPLRIPQHPDRSAAPRRAESMPSMGPAAGAGRISPGDVRLGDEDDGGEEYDRNQRTFRSFQRFVGLGHVEDSSNHSETTNLRAISPVDRDFVAAAKRGEESIVPLEELAARMDRAAAREAAEEEQHSGGAHGEGFRGDGMGVGEGALAGEGDAHAFLTDSATRHKHRHSVFQDLMRAQHAMLVIEYCKGAATVRYRHMRRVEILAEARKYATATPSLPASLTGELPTAELAQPVPVPVAATDGLAGSHIHSAGSGKMHREPSSGYLRQEASPPNLTHGVSFIELPTQIPPPTTAREATSESHRFPPQPTLARLHSQGMSGGVGMGAGGYTPGHARPQTVTSLLQNRDLRVLEASTELGKEPAILVRRHSIVISLPPIRALIMSDKLFFFPGEGADDELVPILQQLQQLGQTRRAGGAGAGADEEEEQPSDDREGMPFEYLVLETFMVALTTALKADFAEMSPKLERVIKKLSSHRTNTANVFNELRMSKKRLEKYISHLKAVLRVLEELLGTSEDLRSMALTHLLESERAFAAMQNAIYTGAATSGGETGRSRSAPTFSADVHAPLPYAAHTRTASASTPAVSALAPVVESTSSRTSTVGDYSLAAPGTAPVSDREDTRSTVLHTTPAVVAAPTFLASPSGGDGAGVAMHPFMSPASYHQATAFVDGIALDEYEDVAEVLLESYLAEVEALLTKAKLIRDELEGAENNMNLVLATNRNKLLKTEIGITTVTMCMTACTVVAGYFGMNLRNNNEDNNATFLTVVIACSAGATFIALMLALYLRRLLR